MPTSPAAAAPDPAEARRVFVAADAICRRDAGRFWGRSLCGPIMLVDWRDRGVVTNAADAGGVLKPADGVFAGRLPPSVIVANTPTHWSGTRWTQLVGPIEGDSAKRQVLLAHELCHRVQRDLKLTRPEQADHHLDTLDGRYLLQIEWRALARALPARGDRRAAPRSATRWCSARRATGVSPPRRQRRPRSR